MFAKILIISTVIFSFASLSDVRSLYKSAINSSSKADELVNKTKGDLSNGVMRAYYGTGLALQAKHSWNPSTKLSKAKEAVNQLNTAVSKSVSDVEIRFLRFSFEANLPSIVGATKHLTEDKKFILSNLKRTHPMFATMKSFLASCSELTAEEKKKVNAL